MISFPQKTLARKLFFVLGYCALSNLTFGKVESPESKPKPSPAQAFEMDRGPGEGGPVFRAKSPLRLHRGPQKNSPLNQGVRVLKGRTFRPQDTRYRILKSGVIRFTEPVTVKGLSYGHRNRLFFKDTIKPYENSPDTIFEKTWIVAAGESLEYLIYLGEGEFLFRIRGEVASFSPLQGYKIEAEPVTEWWVRVADKKGKPLGWVFIDEKQVELVDREF